MNKDQLALEAAQSSFAKISQLSLFKYMNWWGQVFIFCADYLIWIDF
jgi:hypothetical protein